MNLIGFQIHKICGLDLWFVEFFIILNREKKIIFNKPIRLSFFLKIKLFKKEKAAYTLN